MCVWFVCADTTRLPVFTPSQLTGCPTGGQEKLPDSRRQPPPVKWLRALGLRRARRRLQYSVTARSSERNKTLPFPSESDCSEGPDRIRNSDAHLLQSKPQPIFFGSGFTSVRFTMAAARRGTRPIIKRRGRRLTALCADKCEIDRFEGRLSTS